jgi:lipopolysaccharide export system permease protein
MPLGALDRYLLGETIRPLTVGLGIVLSALLLERMLRLFDLLVNKGGPFVLVLKMVANLVPHYMGMALPAAFFLSVLVAVSRLSAENELDAMLGCGISLKRLIAPLHGLAVVLTIAAAFLYAYLKPHSRYAYRSIVYLVTNAAWEAILEEGVFVTAQGRNTIMVDQIEAGGRTLHGVFVHQYHNDGSASAITAARGSMERSDDGTNFLLRLIDGQQIITRPDERQPSASTFNTIDFRIDLTNNVPPFRARGENEREMTLLELFQRRNQPGDEGLHRRIGSELHGRLARIASIPVLPFVALPLGISAKRARRASGLLIAGILLFLYHHALQFGESMTDLGRVPPIIGIWGPFLLFAASGAWLFLRASSRPGADPFANVADLIGRGLAAAGRLLPRRRPA